MTRSLRREKRCLYQRLEDIDSNDDFFGTSYIIETDIELLYGVNKTRLYFDVCVDFQLKTFRTFSLSLSLSLSHIQFLSRFMIHFSKVHYRIIMEISITFVTITFANNICLLFWKC